MGNILSTTIPSISNMYFITLNPIPSGTGEMVVIGTFSCWCMSSTTIEDIYNQMIAWWGTTTQQIFLINNTIVIYDLVNTIHTPSPISGPINLQIIPAQPSPRIIGYANIRQTTVLFTTNCIAEDGALVLILGLEPHLRAIFIKLDQALV